MVNMRQNHERGQSIRSITLLLLCAVLFDYKIKFSLGFPVSKHKHIGKRAFSAHSSSQECRLQNEKDGWSIETATDLSTSSRSTEISTKGRKKNKEEKNSIKHQSHKIASTFETSDFRPVPYLTNRHIQTILGVFLRKYPGCTYVSPGIKGILSIMESILDLLSTKGEDNSDVSRGALFWDDRERIETPDGDFFHVDYKYSSGVSMDKSDRGMVILVHGFESNANSSLAVDMANAYLSKNFDVACINFRGCCGEPNNNLGSYHVGFTDDLIHFLGILNERCNEEQQRPLFFLSGFSLGANVVLKALGELGEDIYEKFNVRAAAVTGAPFDIERNINFLDSPGFNRIVYSGNFLKTVKQKAQYQLDKFCESNPDSDAFDYRGVMKATTIAEVDNCYVAPIYGFKDNIDYYRKNSCVYFLDGIAVPTLIINAGDDPFFDPNFFPREKGCDGGINAAPIKMMRTDHGGHLGFMFHQQSKNLNDEATIDVRMSQDSNTETEQTMVASWMPSELARFLDHASSHPECL